MTSITFYFKTQIMSESIAQSPKNDPTCIDAAVYRKFDFHHCARFSCCPSTAIESMELKITVELELNHSRKIKCNFPAHTTLTTTHFQSVRNSPEKKGSAGARKCKHIRGVIKTNWKSICITTSNIL